MSTARIEWLFSLDKESRTTRWGISLIGTISIFLVWQVITAELGLLSESVLPAPTQIVESFQSNQQLILKNLKYTLLESAVGFVAAVVLALLVSFLLTMNDRVRNSFMPLVLAGNSVPRVSFAPIILFYFGGFQAKYVIAAWVAFFPMLVNTLDGMANLNEDLELFQRSLGANIWQEYRYFRIPNALPFIFDGMKVAVTLAIVGAVVGEFVSAERGIGYLALFALKYHNIPLVFALVGLMGVISVCAFVVLFTLQDKLVHWENTSFLTE
jgi:NitT/TauT family transport system permease protein